MIEEEETMWGKIESNPNWYEECNNQILRNIEILNTDELVLITSYLTSRRDLQNWLKVMPMLKTVAEVSRQFEKSVNKYLFGCKACNIYFPSSAALVFHNQTTHQARTVEKLIAKFFKI